MCILEEEERGRVGGICAFWAFHLFFSSSWSSERVFDSPRGFTDAAFWQS